MRREKQKISLIEGEIRGVVGYHALSRGRMVMTHIGA